MANSNHHSKRFFSRFSWRWTLDVAFCIGCFILLQQPSTVWAQTSNYTARLRRGEINRPTGLQFSLEARSVPRSRPSESLGSATVDPLMTTEEEKRVLDYLYSWDATDWNGLTLEQLAQLLNREVPTYLNRIELEIMGIDPGMMVQHPVTPGRVFSRLCSVLETFELTVAIQRGQLMITSQDYADSEPMNRIYDVAPIILRGDRRMHGPYSGDYDGLLNTIRNSIEPDSWVVAGGTSSITPYLTDSRSYLVVSAPLLTQLHVAAFLETMNRGEQSNASALVSGRSVSLQSQANGLPRSYLKLSTGGDATSEAHKPGDRYYTPWPGIQGGLGGANGFGGLGGGMF